MFDSQNIIQANNYYKSLVKYPDKYHEQVCAFLSGYFALRTVKKEDVKRLIEFIDNVKTYQSSHSSLYVLQSYLFDKLNYSFKP